MNLFLLRTLAHNELRLRMRRLSTMVVLLALIGITWAMIPDIASGMTLISIGGARVRYTSATLAFGSAALITLLFGLGGFYLIRGRIAEDVRSGAGGVIGASAVGNGEFLLGRWLGAVAYLCALIVVFMLTMLVCHLLRGEGPIELLVYLQTYAVVLLPMVFFVASCALLFDSVPWLMGKGGDFLYFVLWMVQLSAMSQFDKLGGKLSLVSAFDFTGMSLAMYQMQQVWHTTGVSVGVSTYNTALAPLTMAPWMWDAPVVGLRVLSAALALLPLGAAALLFHRFSPDRVKAARGAARRTPLAMFNQWLQPLTRLTGPVLRLAAHLPQWPGQVLADIALTFASAPVAIVALAATLVASVALPLAQMKGVLVVVVGVWGVLMSDMSTRDHQADTGALTGAVGGGITRRYLRQLGASIGLGLLFMGVVALRLVGSAPLLACAVIVGIVMLSALASLMGRCTSTPRTFMSLFLFGLYVAINVHNLAILDAVGFNGVANTSSMLAHLAIGLVAAAAGFAWNQRRA